MGLSHFCVSYDQRHWLFFPELSFEGQPSSKQDSGQVLGRFVSSSLQKSDSFKSFVPELLLNAQSFSAMRWTHCTGLSTWAIPHHEWASWCKINIVNTKFMLPAVPRVIISFASDPGVSCLLPKAVKPSSQVSLQGWHNLGPLTVLEMHRFSKWHKVKAEDDSSRGERKGTEPKLKSTCGKAWRWWRARKWRTKFVQCRGNRNHDEEREWEEARGQGRGASHIKQETLS